MRHHHRRRMAAFTLLTGVLVSCGSVVSPAGSDGSAAGATDRPATLATVRVAVDGCTLVGTGRDDVLRGTPGADVMCGHGGHDVLLGRGGDDTLEGGSGSDSLFGGTGADAVEGGDGIDLLDGGTRADVLDGGAGRDRCDLGPDDTVTSCATPSGSPVIAAAGDIACPSDYAVSV
ncbi:MAG TPA: hypothetical protein VFZ96_07520, partial [Actinomycetota bacterium]|nr:hypothetical protein [Actinomycetota bacterium]